MLQQLLIVAIASAVILIAGRYTWGRVIILYITLMWFSIPIAKSYFADYLAYAVAAIVCYFVVAALELVVELVPFKFLRAGIFFLFIVVLVFFMRYVPLNALGSLF